MACQPQSWLILVLSPMEDILSIPGQEDTITSTDPALKKVFDMPS